MLLLLLLLLLLWVAAAATAVVAHASNGRARRSMSLMCSTLAPATFPTVSKPASYSARALHALMLGSATSGTSCLLTPKPSRGANSETRQCILS
jgi:hypothetical protein